MSAKDILNLIKEGIHSDYSYNEKSLIESQEEMNVPLTYKDKDCLIICPKDNEKEHLWSCFSSNTDLNIADYIIFKIIDDEVIAFIIELKNNKTTTKTAKATKQITSTHALVKMIYEKTTNINPKDLRTIGLRVFGPDPRKKAQKIPRTNKREIEDTTRRDLLAISSFTQNTKTAKLTDLENLYNKTREKLLFH